MTDKELTEAAAKAAGLWDYAENCIDIRWSPLHNDGDALRLAIKLRLNIAFTTEYALSTTWEEVQVFAAYDENGHTFCPSATLGSDPAADIRRTIVRAAAGTKATREAALVKMNEIDQQLGEQP